MAHLNGIDLWFTNLCALQRSTVSTYKYSSVLQGLVITCILSQVGHVDVQSLMVHK